MSTRSTVSQGKKSMRTTLPRRRLAIGYWGITAVSAIANSLDSQDAGAALAAPFSCCNLGSSQRCDVSSCPSNCKPQGTMWGCSYYTCPSTPSTKYHQETWACHYGGRVIVCGECVPTTSNTCETGPFPCSVAWDDGTCP